MKSVAKSIFKNAQIYEKAAWVIQSATMHEMALLLPRNVNAALSLELYFKSLNILEHGIEFKINNKHSHHFAQLFQELKEVTKRSLNERFEQAIFEMDPNEFLPLETAIGGVIPKDLKSNLVVWASVFTDLRYLHTFTEKNKNQKFTMAFFPQIANSV